MRADGLDPMRTRRYEIAAPERGAVRSVDIAEPGPGQLLVRVMTNGVCASDLPLWIHGAATPQSIGHEPVGEVVAVGPGVRTPRGSIVGGRISSSFAEFALADQADVVVVPDSIDPTLVIPEPIGCVAEALRRTRLPFGARVAVVGCGYMGLVMVQMLRASGAAHIVALDPREDGRAAALKSGADEAWDGVDLPPRYFMDRGDSESRGFDVVIEASGSQAGLDVVTRMVRPHGIVTVLGYHQGARSIDMHTWNWKAIDVVNGHVRDRDLLRKSTVAALQMQAAGRIDMESLITHRYRFEEIDEAFRSLRRKPTGFVKAIIDFS